jgi:LysR family glycine cleavage system transcriptional activator
MIDQTKKGEPRPSHRKTIPPFASLRAFDAVARLGGVRKAAEELQLDHAVVSRHLRALEAWTGTTLFNRERSGLTLTAEGKRYHRRICQAIDLISEATTDLMKLGDERELTIWCMPGFASKWLISRIGGFEARQPGLTIEVRPSDSLPEFNRNEADVDIWYAPTYGQTLELASNLRSIEIARPAVVPVASPEYLRTHPPIQRVADLLSQNLLHEENFENWRAWFEGHGVATKDLHGIKLWHAHLTVDAACQSRGVALANHFLAVDDVRAGRLVEIRGEDDPFERLSLGSYLFIARTERWSNPSVAAFRQWLISEVRREIAG